MQPRFNKIVEELNLKLAARIAVKKTCNDDMKLSYLWGITGQDVNEKIVKLHETKFWETIIKWTKEEEEKKQIDIYISNIKMLVHNFAEFLSLSENLMEDI